jgi:VCBS repeat-containing protein
VTIDAAGNTATLNIADDDNLPVVTPQVFTVAEDAAIGTSLGLVAATDPDVPTVFQTWTIVSGNTDGIFDINPATGELTVIDNTNLDFETLPTSYALGITVSDGTNTSAVGTVTVNVGDVNENPVLNTNAGLNLNEDTTAGIANTALSVTDPDIPAQTLTYSVTTAPAFGQLLLSGLPTASFTQADIDGGLLSYAHDGSETTADSFSFTVADGAGGVLGTQTFLFSVAAVNDAPVNSVPGSQTTIEDTQLVFNTANSNRISISDADLPGGIMEVKLVASHGTLTLATTAGLSFVIGGGTGGDAVLEFTGTAAAINAALNGLQLDPTPDFNGASTLTIQTDDYRHRCGVDHRNVYTRHTCRHRRSRKLQQHADRAFSHQLLATGGDRTRTPGRFRRRRQRRR